jgi:hypothetical protein
LRKDTPAEIQPPEIAKTTRTLIRLKHSLAADEEINTVLSDTLKEFDEALARGELKELKFLLDDVIGTFDAVHRPA